MKLKIVSDGTNAGTKLYDEMGNRIENVVAIDWSMRVGDLSRATIEIKNIELETGVPKESREVPYRLKKRLIRLCQDKVIEVNEALVARDTKLDYTNESLETLEGWVKK